MKYMPQAPTQEQLDLLLDQLTGWLNDPDRVAIAFADTDAGETAYLSPMPANIRKLLATTAGRGEVCSSCGQHRFEDFQMEFIEVLRSAALDRRTNRRAI